MRDYGKVTPKFWIGETGKALRGNMEAQIVAIYLMTGPHSEWTGVFHCPILYIAHETGLPFEGASKGLQSLIEAGFCIFDEASETVFVFNMAAHQIGEELKASDKRVAGVRNEVKKWPQGRIKTAFIERYNKVFCLGFEEEKPMGNEAPSKPLRSQEHEQEQEQEQKKNTLSGKPDDASEILDYLNAKTGKHFRAVKANRSLVQARLRDSSPQEIRNVIDDRVRAWASDPKMAEYLRPATLFAASNFESYLGNIGSVPQKPGSAGVFAGVRVDNLEHA